MVNNSKYLKENFIQQNFNGFNTLNTMKIYWRQGYFELISDNHSARSVGIIKCLYDFV